MFILPQTSGQKGLLFSRLETVCTHSLSGNDLKAALLHAARGNIWNGDLSSLDVALHAHTTEMDHSVFAEHKREADRPADTLVFVLHAPSLRSGSCSPYRKTNLLCYLMWTKMSQGREAMNWLQASRPLKMTQLLLNFTSSNPPAWNLGTSQAPSDFVGMNYLTPLEEERRNMCICWDNSRFPFFSPCNGQF